MRTKLGARLRAARQRIIESGIPYVNEDGEEMSDREKIASALYVLQQIENPNKEIKAAILLLHAELESRRRREHNQ